MDVQGPASRHGAVDLSPSSPWQAKKVEKMTTYFGFGLADNMFPAGQSTIRRRDLTPEEAKAVVRAGVEPCLNPSHALTIGAMRTRFDIDVRIPEKAPIAKLAVGDRLLVMGVSGLPRLEGRHEYTAEEIEGAKFRFGLYTVEA